MMTEQEFLDLEPREQDALVAEKVMDSPEPDAVTITTDPREQKALFMGLAFTSDTHWQAPNPISTDARWRPSRFAQEIEPAWQVVEKMRAIQGDGAKREVSLDSDCGKWVCEIGIEGWATDLADFTSEADTAPLAICIAALKAVGEIE